MVVVTLGSCNHRCITILDFVVLKVSVSLKLFVVFFEILDEIAVKFVLELLLGKSELVIFGLLERIIHAEATN